MPTSDATTRIERHAHNDFSVFIAIDGVEEYIGSRATYALAEALGREYRFSYFEDRYTPEKAAAVVMEMVGETR